MIYLFSLIMHIPYWLGAKTNPHISGPIDKPNEKGELKCAICGKMYKEE